MALEAGVPTKTHILNLLHRLIDAKPITTPPVTAPQTLRLVSEPMANVECQWAPKFPQMWALKIPYVGGLGVLR